jgi:hypothetical protein
MLNPIYIRGVEFTSFKLAWGFSAAFTKMGPRTTVTKVEVIARFDG